MNSDKLYVIIIIGMIGVFIYWYQTRLDQESLNENRSNKDQQVYCSGCKQRMIKRKDKHNSKHSDRSENTNRNSNLEKPRKTKNTRSRSSQKIKIKDDNSIDSQDSIPDSIIESRLKSKSDKRSKKMDVDDDDSEISIESLDTVDRSEASNSRKDDDTLSMVDGTLDSNAGTIDID